MTQLWDGTSYFLYLAYENENTLLEQIKISDHRPGKNATVTFLGIGKKLKWAIFCDGFKVNIPKVLRNNPPCQNV
jgi:hypothetical protein